MMSLQKTKGFSRASVLHRTMEDFPTDLMNNNNNLSTILRGFKIIEFSLRTCWGLCFLTRMMMKVFLLPMFLEFSKNVKKVEVIASGKACFQLSTGFLGDFGHIITSVSFLTFILLTKIKISSCTMKVVDGKKKVSKIWF